MLLKKKELREEAVSLLELLFIDISEDLPGVIDKLKVLVIQLRHRVTQFCKHGNLLVILKLRDFYRNIRMKIKELEIRTSMPLLLGIFML